LIKEREGGRRRRMMEGQRENGGRGGGGKREEASGPHLNVDPTKLWIGELCKESVGLGPIGDMIHLLI